jgi:hypothetical protein
MTAQAYAFYTAQSSRQTPEPLSFDEIARRIANNEPIPGIKTIPDELSTEAPSEAVLAKQEGLRKKPWES